jgi:hypothetical protein
MQGPSLDKINIFKISVFDDHLQRLWEKEIELPSKGQFDHSDYVLGDVLSEDGDYFFLMQKNPRQEPKIKTGITNQRIILRSFQDKGKKYDTLSLALEKGLMTEFKLMLANKNIFCVGTYSLKSYYGYTKGFYSYQIDPKKQQIIYRSQLPIDNNYIFSYIFRHYARPVDINDEFENLMLRDASIGINNQILITAEQEHHSGKYGMTISYNDILIASLNPDGSKRWIRNIQKNSSSGSSFAAIYDSNKIRLLFYDSPDKSLKNFFRSSPTIVEIDSSGMVKKQIIDIDAKKFTIKPSFCMQVSPNELLLYSTRSTKARIGLLKVLD